jgi:hypothetical protein
MKAIRIRRTSVVLHHAKELAIGLVLGASWVFGGVGIASLLLMAIQAFR